MRRPAGHLATQRRLGLRGRLLVLAASAVALLPAAEASAQTEEPAPSYGFAVAPAVLAPPPIPRGAGRTETLIVTGLADTDQVVALRAVGEVAPWLAFIDSTGAPVEEITVPAGRVVLVDAVVSVPADTANGTYAGRVELTPVDEEASATTTVPPVSAPPPADAPSDVRVGAAVPVVVQAGGEMVLDGRLVDVRTPLAEVGQPQRIVATFANGGTVGFRPTVEATITRAQLPVAVVRGISETAVGPGRSADVELQWDTADALPGSYEVVVTASADGLSFEPVTASFRLEPAGSAARDGELESLEVVGRPEPGGSARLRAAFRNNSEVAVTAVLLADVELNGRLTGREQSLPVVVPAGRRVDVDIVLEQLEVGSYGVVGIMNYDGLETDDVEVRFDVRSRVARTGGSSSRSTLLLGAVAGLVVVGAGVVVVRRRRSGDDEDDF